MLQGQEGDLVFVDTNILIYAHDLDAGARQEVAAQVLTELWDSRTGRLSTQVLQEFFVNVTQKIRKPLSRSQGREVIHNYSAWVQTLITPATIGRASEIGELWQLSFWDGMIVAAAEQTGARQLLSEYMNAGQVISGIRVVNPFQR